MCRFPNIKQILLDIYGVPKLPFDDREKIISKFARLNRSNNEGVLAYIYLANLYLIQG
ncbi:MAG: hypothetical protein OEZ01_02345 [Candidatus Heimdallarchaeota archaeon]|nr:hypothetical protein [Candidatus Heimdallarchaeota archaeon]MDH5644816.1 hypothetical protein [Candidatus Heimdallarchaeota archaeon]